MDFPSCLLGFWLFFLGLFVFRRVWLVFLFVFAWGLTVFFRESDKKLSKEEALAYGWRIIFEV